MSLYKQLWLSIVLFTIISFIGSFLVSCFSAKTYLEEQLLRKNVDNAASLAISLSSQGQDALSRELYISAQFDTGHYDWIVLVGTDGNIITKKATEKREINAPNWVRRLFEIKTTPGTAQVSSGWQQIGTLHLASTSYFAYEQLWINIKRLFIYFLVIALSAGLLGTWLLRIITSPLNRAVMQAEAIGERRFITTEEPGTLEFRAVIRSLNKLSAHVKKMLNEETVKLDHLRQQMQVDAVTGLLNREPVLNYLHSFLQSNDINSRGLIVIVRVLDLYQLNKAEGRQNIDSLLKRFGKTLTEASVKDNGIAGRLNGSDLVLVLPRVEDSPIHGRAIFEALQKDCRELKLTTAKVVGCSTAYYAGESSSKVLRRIDNLLMRQAEIESTRFEHVNVESETRAEPDKTDWETLLPRALMQENFELELFPVHAVSGATLHYEAPVRLKMDDGKLLQAGIFMPYISRFRLTDKLDLLVLKLAQQRIEETQQPIGINLSASLLHDYQAIVELVDAIKSKQDIAHMLWLEVPEFGAFRQLDNFRILCQLLKPLSCKLGIEHVSQEFARIGELHDLGLDFIKVDRSVVHTIDATVGYQVFLRGLCTIVHSIGLQVIAEGVESASEWETLKELGIDGGTGEYFTKLS